MRQRLTSEQIVSIYNDRSRAVAVSVIAGKLGVSEASVYYAHRRITHLLNSGTEPLRTYKNYSNALFMLRHGHNVALLLDTDTPPAQTTDPFEALDSSFRALKDAINGVVSAVIEREREKIHEQYKKDIAQRDKRIKELAEVQNKLADESVVGALRKRWGEKVYTKTF